MKPLAIILIRMVTCVAIVGFVGGCCTRPDDTGRPHLSEQNFSTSEQEVPANFVMMAAPPPFGIPIHVTETAPIGMDPFKINVKLYMEEAGASYTYVKMKLYTNVFKGESNDNQALGAAHNAVGRVPWSPYGYYSHPIVIPVANYDATDTTYILSCHFKSGVSPDHRFYARVVKISGAWFVQSM